MASVIKFSFALMAETRDEAIAKADQFADELIMKCGGEPWATLKDEMRKVGVSVQALVSGEPGGSFYTVEREVAFVGPTALGHKVDFRDGFRPQENPDEDDFSGFGL